MNLSTGFSRIAFGSAVLFIVTDNLSGILSDRARKRIIRSIRISGIVSLAVLAASVSTVEAQNEPSNGGLSVPAAIESGTGGRPEGDEAVDVVPKLDEIIPRATLLSGHLADLEKKLPTVVNVSEAEARSRTVEENLGNIAGLLVGLKDSGSYRLTRIVELGKAIEHEKKSLDEVSSPIRHAIRTLDESRLEWQAEKKRWNEWQAVLLEGGVPEQIRTSFAQANQTIDTALDLVRKQLEALLTAQEQVGGVQAKIISLSAELDNLVALRRHGFRLDTSPPMFSSRYLSQFGSELWYDTKKGLEEIVWPDGRFFARQAWIIILQIFLSLATIIAVSKNRRTLNDSRRLRLLAARPVSAGLFVGAVTALWFHSYGGAPDTWMVVVTIVSGIAFVRIFSLLTDVMWKKQFVLGVVVVLVLNKLLYVANIPLPLARLYVVLTALVGFLFCLRRAGETGRSREAGLSLWPLRLGALFFLVILVLELWDKPELGIYLFVTSIESLAIVLPLILFRHIILGFCEWVLSGSPLHRMNLLKINTDNLVRRVGYAVDFVIWILVAIPALLVTWGIHKDLRGATEALLDLGFNLESQRISVGLLLLAAAVLYGSFLLSWMLQTLYINRVLARRGVESGVRHSIERLFHYAIVFVGFLMVFWTLGFDFTKITIILSALSLGIGFGLQNIVNNFVSGLILLSERPVRVGDTIELGGKWAIIKRIGLRATMVQTFDQADVIIPNADLISNQVTNWTLGNRQVRLTVPVGVAYGSDVSLVMNTLLACAGENPGVARTPAPQVLFLTFGESSLDFELRIWVLDADNVFTVRSELHQEIDRRFREANIVIAFPQLDLHLRSRDEAIDAGQ